MGFMSRLGNSLKHAWNAFRDQTVGDRNYSSEGASFGHRPDVHRFRYTTERSIASSIYTRLAIDVASLDIRHVRVDEDGQYVEDINSGLNDCLTVEANLDQAARAFRRDIMMTLFDQGHCAIVPVDTSINPMVSGSYDIQTMRVGEITGWFPTKVQMMLYNEAKGIREQITLDKSFVAVLYNPFYSVMNEPNSTMKRLIHKLNLLDQVDEATSSGKLDIIIQLPYVIKSEQRREQAKQRREDLEKQLSGSKYGVAYTDGTEKVVQLNRPAENNLLKQIEYLTAQVYGQLGLTEDIMNGTADEKTMLHYLNRTIEPLVTDLIEAMRRVFLTKTGRTQGQDIMYFKNPFKLAPLTDMAEIADKFTRNEVLSSNELRGMLGIRPSKDPKADQLHNSNMPEPTPPPDPSVGQQGPIKVGPATVSRPQLTSAPSGPSKPQRG